MLPFPCKILGVLPLLSATATPDELSVIHSIVAEPPNNGIDRRGALNKSQQEMVKFTVKQASEAQRTQAKEMNKQ